MRVRIFLVWVLAAAVPGWTAGAGLRPGGAGPVTIVAFGDSTTAPRGTLAVYPQVLERDLAARGLSVRVINAGVSGNTTAHARERFRRDVLDRQPHLVIIQLGVNDSAVDVNKGADKPRLPRAEYEKNLRYFVRTLRARGTGVILMTPSPRRWTAAYRKSYGKPPYKPDDPDGFNVLLREYVESMRRIAAAEGVPLVDVFARFGEYHKAEGQAMDELFLDGIHPNDKGHRLVADLLIPRLMKMAGPATAPRNDGVRRIRLLPPGRGNPRNSEGDFVQLKDGRLLFVYTHFTGGGADHSAAHLAGRFSSDGGKTWTKKDVVIVPNEGRQNVMSVSLLRLRSGAIALFYLRKNSLEDCRPYVRISKDEAKTWSQPRLCAEPVGYYVLNNDRVVQLRGGRLVAPVSCHNHPGLKWSSAGVISCCLSDDEGKTWRRSRTELNKRSQKKRVVLQEPGVVELKDGRLMMFMRTTMGSQYLSFSTDGGETWSPARPSKILSPCSPASIERIPKTGDLLLVWNDHKDVDAAHRGKRTPFKVAVSRDGGKTWRNVKTLEDDPGGWYCYTAVEFVGQRVLLAHCAGQRKTGGLNLTQITSFDVDWLYR